MLQFGDHIWPPFPAFGVLLLVLVSLLMSYTMISYSEVHAACAIGNEYRTVLTWAHKLGTVLD
jgi:hypothetical protein